MVFLRVVLKNDEHSIYSYGGMISAISPMVQREKCVNVLYIHMYVPHMCVCGIPQIHRGEEEGRGNTNANDRTHVVKCQPENLSEGTHMEILATNLTNPFVKQEIISEVNVFQKGRNDMYVFGMAMEEEW